MLKFLNLKEEIFGLDINDTSLKIIKLKKRGRFFRPVSFNDKDIAPGIIKEGAINDEGSFIKTVREAVDTVKGQKLGTKYAAVSLPEQKSFSQVIQMPKMDTEELKLAVPFEVENYIPLPSDQIYLDFERIYPIARGLDHLDIFIVGIEKKLVDSYVSCLKKANIIPVALEVETQALARVLIKNGTTLCPTALVDLGSDSANFIVFSGHSVKFTSSMPVSSKKITEIVSKELGISFREAEHLKTKYGLKFKDASYGASEAAKVIGRVLEALVAEIQKYMDFYAVHDFHDHFFVKPSKENKIERIILSGGGADLKGIKDFLQNRLKVPVETGNPWINFPLAFKKFELYELQKKSLSFATALGLAMRNMDE